MMRYPAIYFLLLTAILAGCKKEYSCEGPACRGIVPYEIDCQSTLVSGTYTKGITLSTADTVVLTLRINEPGSYSFSTAVVNGISFSGTANFTSTGTSNLILTGQGTPVDSGSYTYNIKNTSCSFIITAGMQPTQPNSADTFFYEATIGGVNYGAQVLPQNGYVAWSAASIMGADDLTATLKANISLPGDVYSPGYTSMSVFKGWRSHLRNCTDAYFKAYFLPGTQQYGDCNVYMQPLSHGVKIIWRDPNGGVWTSGALAQQPASSFVITDCQDGAGGNYYRVKIRANFHCRLIKSGIGGGEVRELTNGKFYGFFEKQF